jgi:hypothetical protein
LTTRRRPLPVVASPPPAPAPRFRPGRWRAVVLLAVHLVVALHVVHWLRAGETLSPVEPSEAMALSARGVVNAGAVFFALALASTAALGRWFCGWGCHVVALQDASRALLLRLGITPRPLRSRALALVPLLAFLYMFVLPFAQRLTAGGPLGVQAVELTTRGFWDTFPAWPVALVTFVVCGFLCVLLLGSKGFCTYACPYGAAFGLLDRLAPWRIRVSDACNSCGKCTAGCSSNVLVHAEVRDHGMVVDPGCMKCLDCVATCPTGALSYSFGAPAPLARPAARTGAFTWREEAFLAVAFVGAFLAWRGVYHLVPFLLALGLAGVLAWTWLLALRVVRRPSAKLLRWHLRREGRVTPAGGAFLVVAGALLLATAHSGAVQALSLRARGFHADTAGLRPSWSAQLRDPAPLSSTHRAALEEGVARERALARLSLVADPELDLRLAWLCLLLGDDAGCEEAIRRAAAALPDAAPLRVDWADLLVARGRVGEALDVLVEAVRLEEASGVAAGARDRLAGLSLAAGLAALERGDRAAAEAHLERALLARRDVQALVALAFLLDKRGERERAATLLAEARALEGDAR